MVNWSLLQNATSPDNKPTPGWLFHEICLDVRGCPKDCPDVAEYLMQCVCSDQLNIQLKAVLTIKHLALEDITFQQYMQACPGALRILEDVAAPPIIPQARSLEPQEVRTVRDATRSALDSIYTPPTVERSTESASLKQRIHGFGNFEPPPEEQPAEHHGVVGQVAEFVGDSVGDMVDDFREKGAVGALKDATIDALDLVLDGVDAVWSWVAGKSEDTAPRICQPIERPLGASTVTSARQGDPSGILPGTCGPPLGVSQPLPMQQPRSVGSHYAAAFGGGVIGANNPVLLQAPTLGPADRTVRPELAVAAPTPACLGEGMEQCSPEAQALAPATVVDLLSMNEEPVPTGESRQVPDLLGDLDGSSPAAPPLDPAKTAPDALEF